MRKRSVAVALLALMALVVPASTNTGVTHLLPGPLTQNWSNTGLITVDDDWSAVTSIVGYRGDNLTAVTGVDPTTVTAADDPGIPDVNANRSDPNAFISGGVSEFESNVPTPVVALQGSGTADAPYIQFYVKTTSVQNVTVAYDLVDVDGSADNATQQFTAQYRVGNTGTWTNVAGTYVADASQGPSLSGQVTAVSGVLGSDANDQPLVQIRIITTNAGGNDEWVGVDNIRVSGTNTKTVPAASEWALMVLAVLMTGAGALYVFNRRRSLA